MARREYPNVLELVGSTPIVRLEKLGWLRVTRGARPIPARPVAAPGIHRAIPYTRGTLIATAAITIDRTGEAAGT